MAGLFISTLRWNRIADEKAVIVEKMNEASEKLLDVQHYSALISNGSISLNDIANAPSSIFSRLVNFTNYSTSTAMQNAQNSFSQFTATGQMPTFADAVTQQNYQGSVFQSFYKQAMDACIKVEQKLLHALETKIQKEIKNYETKLSMLEKEASSCENMQQKAIA